MTRNRTEPPPRIVFFRPHAEIWFKDPVRAILKGHHLPHKYEPWLDHALASNAEVYFSTMLHRQAGWKGFVKFLLEPIELLVWCRLNRIPWDRFRLVLRRSQLADMDALILMHYGNFTHEMADKARRGHELARALEHTPVRKIVHMTHYAYHPGVGAANLAVLRPAELIAENDLEANSPFFRKYFGSLDAKFERLPYIASKRFRMVQPFESRINKLVATGSITYQMRAPEFTEYFRTSELQPLRRKLFEQADRYREEMDCLISDLNATRPSTRGPGRARRLFDALRGRKHPQEGYYKQDIVATYNAYTMFVVPEEICDLPAIGFVEGMACGCVYFGLDDPMFRDLGMEPDTHYVAHDGTVDGLMRRVRDYQAPAGRAELERIAENGRALVEARYRSHEVYSQFQERIAARTESAPGEG